MKNFLKNQKDISFFIKSFFVSLFIFSWLFILSFMTTTLVVEDSSSSKHNNQNQMLSEEQTYTVYKNTDPIIKKLELFLAQNQSRLTPQEIQKIENLRSQRITELMAKKYLDVIEQKP